ncbi:MAG: hypothetical protein ABSG76_02805 [Xanthobacteraceae bacterium]|jgi:hypothetical protein
MPTYDGGHYFLSAVVPIRTDTMNDGLADTSPVHALRKRLSMLPTAAQTPACGNVQCPFALSTRTHFARLAIIDDVAYNGREGRNTLLGQLFGTDLVIAQPQDHLSCPFLLFAVDFDAASGADSERRSYLVDLWDKMGPDLRNIFAFCQGFEQRVKDGSSFADYIAACQLETTMSFNDYYVDSLNLPTWPSKAYLWAGGASLLAVVLGLAGTLILLVAQLFGPSLASPLRFSVVLTAVGIVALVIVAVGAYASVMAAGEKPFPTAPDSNLPTVLKALHLQRAFTRFAIDSQMLAVGTDGSSAQRLYDEFATFLAVNKPNELGDPTQKPGVIGV